MISRLSGYFTKRVKQSLYQEDFDNLKVLVAKNLIRQGQTLKLSTLAEAEFQVFSQFGDDGIIQHLITRAKLKPDEYRFVEFGVEDYREANTRFLILNNHWSGLVIESDAGAVEQIKHQSISWKYPLTAVSRFITRKNIVSIINEAGFADSLGLLSIDIDGNDYWIAEAILKSVKPIILIVEFNALWGRDLAVTIPYRPNFSRFQGHFSGTFWGASIKAFQKLAKRHGYAYIGTNTAGLNAYFIRRDRLGRLKPVPLSYSTSKTIRDSRDQDGQLNHLSPKDCLSLLSDLKLYNLESGKLEAIKNLFADSNVEKKFS